jgi:hypothetical protein
MNISYKNCNNLYISQNENSIPFLKMGRSKRENLIVVQYSAETGHMTEFGK